MANENNESYIASYRTYPKYTPSSIGDLHAARRTFNGATHHQTCAQLIIGSNGGEADVPAHYSDEPAAGLN